MNMFYTLFRNCRFSCRNPNAAKLSLRSTDRHSNTALLLKKYNSNDEKQSHQTVQNWIKLNSL